MSFKTTQFKTFVVIILTLVTFFIFTTQKNATNTTSVSINGKILEAKIAKTVMQKTKGLSGKKLLKKDTGMLFVYDVPQKIGIWMKDMNFPIDIVWIDEKNTIVAIEHNVSPNTFPHIFRPKINTQYVLEVNAGFTKTHNISIGDIIDIPQ